jgi:selenocysteine-specific elongation factor
VDTSQIRRGDVVTHPGQYQTTRRLDARFRLLKDASASLRHGDEVKFFIGASESMGAVRLLGVEELEPGGEGWIQLELRVPVVAVRGDRYILRRPSPGETLGGGAIVDHQPKGRHKRFDENVLKSLESLARGTPADILLEAAFAAQIASVKEIVVRSRLETSDAESALTESLESGKLVLLETGTPSVTSDLLATTSVYWQELRDRTIQMTESYHQAYPLRRGIPREELKSRLKLAPRAFNAVIHKLIAGDLIAERSAFLAMPGHEIRFDGQEQAQVRALMRKFVENPYAPPGVRECRAEVGEEIFNALIELNEVILVSQDVAFRKGDYDRMVVRIKETIAERGRITLAETRDIFNTSRKYAQALLEHLDTINVTMRDGDFRKLRK